MMEPPGCLSKILWWARAKKRLKSADVNIAVSCFEHLVPSGDVINTHCLKLEEGKISPNRFHGSCHAMKSAM